MPMKKNAAIATSTTSLLNVPSLNLPNISKSTSQEHIDRKRYPVNGYSSNSNAKKQDINMKVHIFSEFKNDVIPKNNKSVTSLKRFKHLFQKEVTGQVRASGSHLSIKMDSNSGDEVPFN